MFARNIVQSLIMIAALVITAIPLATRAYAADWQAASQFSYVMEEGQKPLKLVKLGVFKPTSGVAHPDPAPRLPGTTIPLTLTFTADEKMHVTGYRVESYFKVTRPQRPGKFALKTTLAVEFNDTTTDFYALPSLRYWPLTWNRAWISASGTFYAPINNDWNTLKQKISLDDTISLNWQTAIWDGGSAVVYLGVDGRGDLTDKLPEYRLNRSVAGGNIDIGPVNVEASLPLWNAGKPKCAIAYTF